MTASAPQREPRPQRGPDLGRAVREATALLAEAGVPSPRADAELLAAHVLGVGRGELAARALVGAALPADAEQRLAGLVAQRAQRVPLQHLTGRAPFRGGELRVGPGVFVPRPETEVTAGLAIAEAQRRAGPAARPGGVLVVDLCTGSGAIALAVAAEVPSARVLAVELEPEAYAWAWANIEARGLADRVELRLGSAVDAHTGVLADLAGGVDVVVANPPYIPPGARPLEPEVADHDPEAALYGGGQDGLAVPAGVVRAARGLLVPGGLLVMEHADTQGPATRALVDGAGWGPARTVADLAGRPRVLRVRATTVTD